MRARSALVFALPLLGLVYACEDDGGGGATGGFDGGTGGFDAATTEPDAAVPDAQAPVDATVTGAIVNVRSAGAPVAGVTVLFHDAAGAVTGQAKSDAAGHVAVDPVPAMITVLDRTAPVPNAVPNAMITYLGVANGDVLNVELTTPPSEVPSVGSYAVSFTAPNPVATNFEVHVNGDCIQNASDPATPVSVALYPNCVRPTNTIVAAGTDANSVPLQFTFKKGEPAPAANQSRAVTLPAWAAPQTTLVTATNVPGGAQVEGTLQMVADGSAFLVGYPTGAMNAGGLTFRWPQGFPDANNIRVVASKNNGVQALVKRAAPGATATFDFATALPAIVDASAPGATRPDVTVATAGPLTGADAMLVALDWSFLDQSENFIQRRWTFVVPATQLTFKVPALPAELAAFAPPGPSTTTAALAFDSDLLPGYAQAKSLALPLVGPPPQLGEFGVLPANGTLRVSGVGSLVFAGD